MAEDQECPLTIHTNVKAPVVEYLGCCYEFIRPESVPFCPPLPTFPTCFDCFNQEVPGPGPSPGPAPRESPTCVEDLCYCTKDFTEYGVCDEVDSGSLQGMIIVSMFLNNSDDDLKNSLILFAGQFSMDPNNFPIGCKIEVTQTKEQVYWVREDKNVAYDTLPMGERFEWLAGSVVKTADFPFERPDNGVFKIGDNGRITMYPATPHPYGMGDLKVYTTYQSLQEPNRDHSGLFDSWNPASVVTNSIGPDDLVTKLGQDLEEGVKDIEKYISDVSYRRHEANITGFVDFDAEFPDTGPPRVIHDSKTGCPVHLDQTCTPKVVSRSTHTFNYFDRIVFANKPVRVKAVAGGFDIGYVPVNVYSISKSPKEDLNLKEITEASWTPGTEPLDNFTEVISFEDALKKQADYKESSSPRSVSKYIYGDFEQSFDADVVKKNTVRTARCNKAQLDAGLDENISEREGDAVSEFIGMNTLSSSIVKLSDVEDNDIVYLTGIFIEKHHFRQVVQTHTAVGNDRPRYFFPGQSVNEVTWKSHDVEERVYATAGIPWPDLDSFDNYIEVPLDDEDFDIDFWFSGNVYSYGGLLTTQDKKAKFEENAGNVPPDFREGDEEPLSPEERTDFAGLEEYEITDSRRYNRAVNIESSTMAEMFNFALRPHTINGVDTDAWRISEIISDPWMLYRKMFKTNPDDSNAPFSSESGSQSVDLCYGMDADGIKLIKMKSDGTFSGEILIPSDKIRDKNWFKEYMEAYNDDVSIFATGSKKLEDLLLIRVTPKDGIFDNDSDAEEIDRVRWTYAMLSGLLFDVSDAVNSELTDHQKVPYMRDFAYALNDSCVPFRELRLFIRRGIFQEEEDTVSESGTPLLDKAPRSVSKYDPEEGVESPCTNSGVGFINLDLLRSDISVDLVEKNGDNVVTAINDLSFAVFEPKQIVSCKTDRAIFVGDDSFEGPEGEECPNEDGDTVTRPETNVTGFGGIGLENLEERCPPNVEVNLNCCLPRPVLALPRTYDPYDVGNEDLVGPFDDSTFNYDVKLLSYLRRIGVKKFNKCSNYFDGREDSEEKKEFVNIFGGSPSSKEGQPQVEHFINADISEIKQETSIHGIHGDFGENFSAYIETFSIDRQNPLALDRVRGCNDTPIFGGYKNKNTDVSYRDYMANFDCLGVYPETPIEYFNVESNKILEGNISIASNPYLKNGIITTPTYFHNNISFNFIGTDATVDWPNTPIGAVSKKLDGEGEE